MTCFRKGCSLVLLCAVILSMCPITSNAVKKASVGRKSVTLKEGKRHTISIRNKRNGRSYTFKSNKKRIASVTSKGLIRAKKKGNATITVREVKKNGKKRISKRIGRVKVRVIAKKTSAPPQVIPPAPHITPPAVTPTVPPPTETENVTPVFNPDYRELISRSDLTYTRRIGEGMHGFSIANGRLGGPVWQSAADTLTMQINHTDVFMYNDASKRSKDDMNSGGGGIGRIHIGFGSDVFNQNTTQHLSLYDGSLNIEGNGVETKVIADMNSDAIAIHIEDKRSTPGDITVDLTMLRSNAEQINGAHSVITTLSQETKKDMVVLDQVIGEPCDTGITVNDHYNRAVLAATVQGRTVASTEAIRVLNRDRVRLNLPAQNGAFTIIIGGDATMDGAVDVKTNAMNNAQTSPAYEDVYNQSSKWWSDFWNRSYIYLPSQQHFEKRRNYYMYLAAISSRGSYPSKYNGGIWIGQEDRRDWGSFYWNWNQDSLYHPLMAANYTELMKPLFTMRESCYEQYKVAARQMWGNTDGIFIGETAGVLGWETLPDEIASSVKDYYTFKNNTRSTAFTAMTSRRNTYLPVWNWNIFGRNDQASFVTHTLMATQETAEHYWTHYCYTKDLDWLREHAYPFIKGAAELYRNYDGFREENGVYNIYNTNLHEHIWAGKNVIDDLTMARGVFTVAVKAAELLGVDAELRALWEDCRDNMAPYPLRSDPGAIWAASTATGAEHAALRSHITTNDDAWAQGLTPRFNIRDCHGTESPILKMLEKYDLLNLETRDQNLDNGEWDMAQNTFYHSPGYYNQVINTRVDQNGSSRFHIDAAKLGREDDLERILNTQYHVFSVNGKNPNLLFDQLDYYSAEGYGTFAAAVQEGLNQSLSPTPVDDPVIRVFPAWPKAWDAKYKLLAKGGFLVSSSIAAEDIQYVEIESSLGGTCLVRNPWNTDVVVYRNGITSETIPASFNDLLTFETVKGERIVLVRTGTTPDQYRTEELTLNDNYMVNSRANNNMIFAGDWIYDENRTTGDNYLGDAHYTNTDGDYVEYVFTGNGIEFITEVGPDMGEIEVYIDDTLQEVINCYNPAISYKQSVYSNTGLLFEYTVGNPGYYTGRHTIRLVKKSGNTMIVDAFKVWNGLADS